MLRIDLADDGTSWLFPKEWNLPSTCSHASRIRALLFDIPWLSSSAQVSSQTDRAFLLWRGRSGGGGERELCDSCFAVHLNCERRHTKRTDIWHANSFFPLCLFSFILASSMGGSQHGPKSAIPQNCTCSLCKTGTAIPKSPFYTSCKSSPQFAKTGQAFFLDCHSVLC